MLLNPRFVPRAVSWPSTVALALLIAAFVALIAYQGSLPGTKGSPRTELLERLGSQIAAEPENLEVRPGNAIVLGTLDPYDAASAEWSMSNVEFAHILPNSIGCTMSVYVSGPNLSGASTLSTASVELNGSRIATLRFLRVTPDFSLEPGRLAPADVRPSNVPMTPLFNPSALIFPVSSRYCNAEHWTVKVDLRGARWPIERVGIIATFEPAAHALVANPVTVLLAIVIAGALLLGTHLLFNAVERTYGPSMLLLTLLIFVAALVTHDEWDFPVWLRFVDLIAFGHANPATMWGGTPLWPLGMGLIASLLSATYGIVGNGSREISACFLKLAMALAACGNAYVLCRAARPALRRFLFPTLLLSPYVLYELAGGYRELFAGSFFLLGASLALRRRFTYAAVAFAAATSISESLAPLIFLPAALRLATVRIERRSLALATLDAFAGIAPLAFQWIVLIPHTVVATTLSARVSAAYRYGGGSWLSTLDGFGLLPAWVNANATALIVGLSVLLAAPLGVSIVRCIVMPHASEETQRKVIFGAFLGLVAALFLAYRGIDPSTWYTLWAVASFYFIRFEPAGPFPFFLSVMQAVAFYAILGIGDFANSTYVMPSDQSLLGILGKPMLISVFAVNATILALYVSRIAPGFVPLFGRGSTWFLVLFLGAVATCAIKMYAIDIVFCTCASLLIVLAFRRLCAVYARRRPWRRCTPLDYAGLASAIVVGAAAGTQNAAAAVVAFVALLLGLTYGFGACDVVLAIGAPLLLGTQYGFGWVSIAGYVIVSLLAVASLRMAHAASLGSFARPSQTTRLRQ